MATRSRHRLPAPDGTPHTEPALHVSGFDGAGGGSAVQVPVGAPNVVLILLDDVGFGAPSAFGGPCATPTAEAMARNGLRYVRFHTTGICSPTRQCLLTGRNHHVAEMGTVLDMATPIPGYTSVRPNTVATLAEVLRLNGYGTAAFGKWHQTPTWEVSDAGPFDRWPTGEGFERFYGFIGAATDQYRPALYEGTRPIEPPFGPEEDYHFSEDITDRAIDYIRHQHSLTPGRPFFVYLSFGATHAPLQVPEQWIEPYAGRFDRGWDAVRAETLARQKAIGVVPDSTRLTRRLPVVPGWDELSRDDRVVAARLMEVYAGFLSHTDYQVGRLLNAIDDLHIGDNTLVLYILGDNGGSGDGGPMGSVNELAGLNRIEVPTADILERLVDVGTELAYAEYPVGWGHAMNAPYQWTKQVASHWGGTRNGMVVQWPAGFGARDGTRSQFHHVIDIAPTILEVVGVPEPDAVDGVTQKPIDGISLAYTFDHPEAPDRRTTQYFEVMGNRGIYHQGWTAVTKHYAPIDRHFGIPSGTDIPLDEDVWELYDTNQDWSQACDLAKEIPEKLRELKELFLVEASRNNVFPIDDRSLERFNARLVGRQDLMGDRRSLTLWPGMTRLRESVAIDVKNRSHSITAEIDVATSATNGVIVAQGGRFGGWSLYLVKGELHYCYNLAGQERFTCRGDARIGPGVSEIRFEFDYQGDGPGAGGMGTLRINGRKVGGVNIPRTLALSFSLDDETLDVGVDLGSPVTEDYPPGQVNALDGRVNWVRIDVDGDDAGARIDPSHRHDMRMRNQ